MFVVLLLSIIYTDQFFFQSLNLPVVSVGAISVLETDGVIKGKSSSLVHRSSFDLEDAIVNAKSLLVSLGVPENNLCRKGTNRANQTNRGVLDDNYDDDPWSLPFCNHHRVTRYLVEEEKPTFEDNPWFYVIMTTCALGCVSTAALAAGLTMGMLSIDPLMLLVKMRASNSQKEKDQAQSLLPIVKQHHFLLVTLLLLNSIANEALPLFLEVLVSPVVSVILSVTLVLIFGEILPSAIFTGPQKLELASRMVPIVKGVMVLVWPIAYPIAKVLDRILHEDEDGDGAFDRGEISALVRIQYEERMAQKRQRKLERMKTSRSSVNEKIRKDSLTFCHPKLRPPEVEAALKAAKSGSIRNSTEIDKSIHVDEVTMVEGALQMKMKTAMDAYTPIHRMFSIPESLILNEENVVDIYSSGYSRIPVFEKDPLKPKSKIAIKGILMTKQLIVVNMSEERLLSTMPLLIPPCVSPKMNLVELLNLFQTGRYGHFALVCARPKIGTENLKEGNAVPAAAGVMGVITLEDVLEELLQEEIYDENDRMEKEAEKIALWLNRKWKSFKRKRIMQSSGEQLSIGSVVVEAMKSSTKDNATDESTSLLDAKKGKAGSKKRETGIFSTIFQNIGVNSEIP